MAKELGTSSSAFDSILLMKYIEFIFPVTNRQKNKQMKLSETKWVP